MSAKLTVSKLREELSKRGLDTSGLKSTLAFLGSPEYSNICAREVLTSEAGINQSRLVNLVSRLDGAVAEEAKRTQSHDASKHSQISDPKVKNEEEEKEEKGKRKVDAVADEEDGKLSKHIKVTDMSKMGVAELKAVLSEKGLLTTGRKAELVERLTEALKSGDNGTKKDGQHDSDVDVEETEEEKKMVVVMKKGCAVLDQYLPDTIKQGFHVLQRGDDIYDAMLNQTNVRDNNNKFYVLQVLESDSGKQWYVYSRWGRVGVKGQDKLFGPYRSSEEAIREFLGKFFDKTKNQWEDRVNFVAYPKKYTWLEMDYEEDKDDDSKGKDKVEEMAVDTTKLTAARPSKLDKRVQDFISLICNISMMKQMMIEIGFDARKMPLGKLSKSTILKGYGVLKSIAALLEEKSALSKIRNSLQQLSSEFYTVIPHDFGFHKMHNFVIDSPQKLKMKLEMVEALGEIEMATKLLSNAVEDDDDPAYSHYKRLNCHMEPLNSDDHEYNLIKQYMENTHAKTHSSYKLELLQVFQVRRDVEEECFKPFGELQNRMLLWHGSRLSNWTGILSQGLRIAPPEAPVSGYMFGKGVYFADMVSKSANYCYTSCGDPVGVLLLCEVALGNMRELYGADCTADQLPEGMLSTKGVGKTAPDSNEYTTLSDGVVVPLGKPVEKEIPKAHLQYNEYIVYNAAQIRMRYLLQKLSPTPSAGFLFSKEYE